MKKHILTLLLLSLFTIPAQAQIQEQEIKYHVGDSEFTGFLAYDDAIHGKRPGVLVVHEWWGHNAYARKRAVMLAKLGYTAFALDMYGSGKQADHPKDAMAFMQAVTGNPETMSSRFNAGLNILQNDKHTQSSNIAAIGYCMGGGIALNMARQGAVLKGITVFHGGLAATTPAKQGDIKGKILVLTGAADPFIPAEQVAAFETEMKAAQVDYQLISYPGAKHSFTNPEADGFAERFGMPVAYDKAADTDSWKRMTKFLNEVLGNK